LEKYASYAAWGLGGVAERSGVGGAPEAQLRRLAKDRFAIGTPAQVTDALLAQHRIGITQVAMRVSWPGMGQDDILAGIELLGRNVLPEVRRRTSAGVQQTVP
jgi:alkanesulfonate monooxygenase SsuD/methylene tetrahydromethanopterin reductase-like flavin-dependent oxidoreductase (luciferase family)